MRKELGNRIDDQSSELFADVIKQLRDAVIHADYNAYSEIIRRAANLFHEHSPEVSIEECQKRMLQLPLHEGTIPEVDWMIDEVIESISGLDNIDFIDYFIWQKFNVCSRHFVGTGEANAYDPMEFSEFRGTEHYRRVFQDYGLMRSYWKDGKLPILVSLIENFIDNKEHLYIKKPGTYGIPSDLTIYEVNPFSRLQAHLSDTRSSPELKDFFYYCLATLDLSYLNWPIIHCMSKQLPNIRLLIEFIKYKIIEKADCGESLERITNGKPGTRDAGLFGNKSWYLIEDRVFHELLKSGFSFIKYALHGKFSEPEAVEIFKILYGSRIRDLDLHYNMKSQMYHGLTMAIRLKYFELASMIMASGIHPCLCQYPISDPAISNHDTLLVALKQKAPIEFILSLINPESIDSLRQKYPFAEERRGLFHRGCRHKKVKYIYNGKDILKYFFKNYSRTDEAMHVFNHIVGSGFLIDIQLPRRNWLYDLIAECIRSDLYLDSDASKYIFGSPIFELIANKRICECCFIHEEFGYHVFALFSFLDRIFLCDFTADSLAERITNNDSWVDYILDADHIDVTHFWNDVILSLERAIEHGSVYGIYALVKRGYELDLPKLFSLIVKSKAVESEKTGYVKILVEALGLDLSTFPDDRYSALGLAIQENNVELFDYLLLNGFPHEHKKIQKGLLKEKKKQYQEYTRLHALLSTESSDFEDELLSFEEIPMSRLREDVQRYDEMAFSQAEAVLVQSLQMLAVRFKITREIGDLVRLVSKSGITNVTLDFNILLSSIYDEKHLLSKSKVKFTKSFKKKFSLKTFNPNKCSQNDVLSDITMADIESVEEKQKTTLVKALDHLSKVQYTRHEEFVVILCDMSKCLVLIYDSNYKAYETDYNVYLEFREKVQSNGGMATSPLSKADHVELRALQPHSDRKPHNAQFFSDCFNAMVDNTVVDHFSNVFNVTEKLASSLTYVHAERNRYQEIIDNSSHCEALLMTIRDEVSRCRQLHSDIIDQDLISYIESIRSRFAELKVSFPDALFDSTTPDPENLSSIFYPLSVHDRTVCIAFLLNKVAIINGMPAPEEDSGIDQLNDLILKLDAVIEEYNQSLASDYEPPFLLKRVVPDFFDTIRKQPIFKRCKVHSSGKLIVECHQSSKVLDKLDIKVAIDTLESLIDKISQYLSELGHSKQAFQHSLQNAETEYQSILKELNSSLKAIKASTSSAAPPLEDECYSLLMQHQRQLNASPQDKLIHNQEILPKVNLLASRIGNLPEENIPPEDALLSHSPKKDDSITEHPTKPEPSNGVSSDQESIASNDFPDQPSLNTEFPNASWNQHASDFSMFNLPEESLLPEDLSLSADKKNPSSRNPFDLDSLAINVESDHSQHNATDPSDVVSSASDSESVHTAATSEFAPDSPSHEVDISSEDKSLSIDLPLALSDLAVSSSDDEVDISGAIHQLEAHVQSLKQAIAAMEQYDLKKIVLAAHKSALTHFRELETNAKASNELSTIIEASEYCSTLKQTLLSDYHQKVNDQQALSDEKDAFSERFVQLMQQLRSANESLPKHHYKPLIQSIKIGLMAVEPTVSTYKDAIRDVDCLSECLENDLILFDRFSKLHDDLEALFSINADEAFRLQERYNGLKTDYLEDGDRVNVVKRFPTRLDTMSNSVQSLCSCHQVLLSECKAIMDQLQFDVDNYDISADDLLQRFASLIESELEIISTPELEAFQIDANALRLEFDEHLKLAKIEKDAIEVDAEFSARLESIPEILADLSDEYRSDFSQKTLDNLVEDQANLRSDECSSDNLKRMKHNLNQLITLLEKARSLKDSYQSDQKQFKKKYRDLKKRHQSLQLALDDEDLIQIRREFEEIDLPDNLEFSKTTLEEVAQLDSKLMSISDAVDQHHAEKQKMESDFSTFQAEKLTLLSMLDDMAEDDYQAAISTFKKFSDVESLEDFMDQEPEELLRELRSLERSVQSKIQEKNQLLQKIDTLESLFSQQIGTVRVDSEREKLSDRYAKLPPLSSTSCAVLSSRAKGLSRLCDTLANILDSQQTAGSSDIRRTLRTYQRAPDVQLSTHHVSSSNLTAFDQREDVDEGFDLSDDQSSDDRLVVRRQQSLQTADSAERHERTTVRYEKVLRSVDRRVRNAIRQSETADDCPPYVLHLQRHLQEIQDEYELAHQKGKSKQMINLSEELDFYKSQFDVIKEYRRMLADHPFLLDEFTEDLQRGAKSCVNRIKNSKDRSRERLTLRDAFDRLTQAVVDSANLTMRRRYVRKHFTNTNNKNIRFVIRYREGVMEALIEVIQSSRRYFHQYGGLSNSEVEMLERLESFIEAKAMRLHHALILYSRVRSEQNLSLLRAIIKTFSYDAKNALENLKETGRTAFREEERDEEVTEKVRKDLVGLEEDYHMTKLPPIGSRLSNNGPGSFKRALTRLKRSFIIWIKEHVTLNKPKRIKERQFSTPKRLLSALYNLSHGHGDNSIAALVKESLSFTFQEEAFRKEKKWKRSRHSSKRERLSERETPKPTPPISQKSSGWVIGNNQDIERSIKKEVKHIQQQVDELATAVSDYLAEYQKIHQETDASMDIDTIRSSVQTLTDNLPKRFTVRFQKDLTAIRERISIEHVHLRLGGLTGILKLEKRSLSLQEERERLYGEYQSRLTDNVDTAFTAIDDLLSQLHQSLEQIRSAHLNRAYRPEDIKSSIKSIAKHCDKLSNLLTSIQKTIRSVGVMRSKALVGKGLFTQAGASLNHGSNAKRAHQLAVFMNPDRKPSDFGIH